MFTTRWAQRMDLCMSCYPILTPYPGTEFYHQFDRDGRITTKDWDKYNGATVVFEPRNFSVKQLRHAQMAAFAEFYSWRSALRRLKVYPLKKRAWVANLGIVQGIRYYYAKRGREIPRFRDFLDPASPAWNYKSPGEFRDDADDAMAATCCTPNPSLAQLAVSHADPYRQAADAIGAINAMARQGRRRAPVVN